ncbi:hypothetical protein Nm8I071_08160 [Nonomuraea sp. TT08I-71]|nr:hypothetical protein Nm8I071_08160 [Nonomuraea sp. TT08I-71]
MTRTTQARQAAPPERIELLAGPVQPVPGLSPVAAYGTDFPGGASTVTGIGVVEGVEVPRGSPTTRRYAAEP